MFESWVFYAFAAVLLVSATLVITSRNPVHSALFLVLAFFSAAGTWLLLRAEFLAIALVVVYVGAVMVLFLFVVMMLDINIERLREGFWRNLPLAVVVGGILVFEMIAVLGNRIYGARAIELMLLAVNLNFIAFSHFLGDVAGQVFVFFILTVAAAESAIGLAILVVLFRNLNTIDVEDLDSLKG